MFKKIIIVATLVLLGASTSFAGTGTANVAVTPHNLSSSGGDWQYAALPGGEDQICIYCHTPHGGTLDQPLWNRDLSGMTGAGKYQSYSGAVMQSLSIATNRAINPESLSCLSCHDGSIGIGDIINNSGAAPDNANIFVQTGFGTNPGARIGASPMDMASKNDLRDDHPISFSYQAVYNADTSKLQPVAAVESKSLVLFGGAAKNVECGTCHDPHVDYLAAPEYDPFLAIPNAGSALCLSCHIK